MFLFSHHVNSQGPIGNMGQGTTATTQAPAGYPGTAHSVPEPGAGALLAVGVVILVVSFITGNRRDRKQWGEQGPSFWAQHGSERKGS